MDCNKCNDLLFDYVDGKLTAEREDLVSFHLENCTGCQEEARILTQVLDLVDQQKAQPVNPFFYTRVKTRLEKNTPFSDRSWQKRLQPVAYGFMLAGAIWFGIFLGTPEKAANVMDRQDQWVSVLREEYNLDSDSESMLENFINSEVQ